VEPIHRASAARLRALLATARPAPAAFRAMLSVVPTADRDAWVDLVLGLDTIPDDGPELPRGCVPYMPCPVDALLRLVEHAGILASDVFLDVGSGVGRAAACVDLLSGARTIGLEIQPALVRAARDLTARLPVLRFSPVEVDAARATEVLAQGSVFFLYCPFSGERLERLLDDLEPIARARAVRIGCVDLPLPPRPWFSLASPPAGDLAVYRSVAATVTALDQ
jgi:hypothetical protein